MPSQDSHRGFPEFREAYKLQGQFEHNSAPTDLWAVEFYPYTEPGVDAIFACIGLNTAIVFRLPRTEDGKVEVIRMIVDEEPGCSLYCCAWSKDITDGTPLLCVAGANAKIKIINVLTGECVRMLTGHGDDIFDLKVSPINPQILASASKDGGIRIWSLDPAHEKYACIAMLEGDRRGWVYTVSWHSTGRYLLSGQEDHSICLWVLPLFPDENTGTRKPTKIFYPHFITYELHENEVDCILFFNDLILSRSSTTSTLLLTSLTGFSSALPPPPPTTAPTSHHPHYTTFTSSSFTPPTPPHLAPQTPPYTRLLTFSTPRSEMVWMHASISPSDPPILIFGNELETSHGNDVKNCEIMFWDLRRLEEYHDYTSSLPNPPPPSSTTSNPPPNPTTPPSSPTIKPKPEFLNPSQKPSHQSARHNQNPNPHPHPHPHPNPASNIQQEQEAPIPTQEELSIWDKKYAMTTPQEPLLPHHILEIPKSTLFSARASAWSNDGRWCVIVGSEGNIVVLRR